MIIMIIVRVVWSRLPELGGARDIADNIVDRNLVCSNRGPTPIATLHQTLRKFINTTKKKDVICYIARGGGGRRPWRVVALDENETYREADPSPSKHPGRAETRLAQNDLDYLWIA